MLGLQSSDFLLDRLYQDFLLLEMLVLRDSPVGVLVPDTPIADPFAIFFWVSTVHCDDSSIDRRVSFKIEPLSCPNTLLPSLRSSMLTLLSFTLLNVSIKDESDWKIPRVDHILFLPANR